MRRLLLITLFFSAAAASAQPRTPLTRALADALYAKLAGGSSVAGTTTFANITVSGTCTGCTSGSVPTTRLVSTTAPLGGGGDLSADRTLTCTTCATSSNNLSFFSATSSAQLLALLNDETGTGLAVFNNSPTLIAPTLGVAVATTINGNTFTAGTYTLTGGAAKTLTFNNTMTLAGTDSTTMTFPSTSATIARTDAANNFIGHQTIEGVTSTGATGTGKIVFDGSPTIVTPTIVSFTNATHNHQNAAGGGTLVDAAITFTAPALGAPTAATLQTSGNIGIGTTPNATTGRRLDILQTGNFSTILNVSNTDAASTGALSSVRVGADTSVVQLSAFGTAFSASLFGVAIGGWSSLNNAAAGSGLLIGTTNSTPMRLGTNGTAAMVIDTSQGVTFSGAVIPSQTIGITGTTTSNNANAGAFGEYQTGTVAANTTSLSTGTTANVGTNTNITLTAGDWDCSGVVNFTFGATTSITNLTGGISTTTGTLPSQDSYFDYETSAMIPTGTAVATWVVPTVRLSNSGSTNVFLVSQATFTASTLKVGGTIRCRRMR